MANSLRASPEGLAIVDRLRRRRGWTKTSTACWWQEAHTSRATLRRFWQGERIQKDIFIAICQTVGIHNWTTIATSPDTSDFEVSVCVPTSVLDWHETPDLERFYGRDAELNQLEQWILAERCQLITIVGLTGIGKTALALALADRIQPQFEYLIWRSCQRYSTPLLLLDSLLTVFVPDHPPIQQIQDMRQAKSRLLHYFQQHRCLLVFDGLESALHRQKNQESNNVYPQFLQFLQQLRADRHQSCLLITSQEIPQAIAETTQAMRYLTLQGLPQADALQVLQSKGFTGKETGLPALIRLYSGNPLALKLIASLIQSLFGGNVTAFLQQNTVIVGDRLRSVLKQQLNHLSNMEREILYWLAIWQEPVSLTRLQTHLLCAPDPAVVLEGLVALERRSLLDKEFTSDSPSFTLQPLVMKVATDELVEQATQEICQVMQSGDIGNFKVIRTHWLLRPGTDNLAGDRVLVQLQNALWRISGNGLPQALQHILLQLKHRSPLAIGYAGCNLMALLNRLDLECETAYE